jgi:hypothetical protein
VPPLDLARKRGKGKCKSKSGRSVQFMYPTEVTARAHIARARLGLVLNYWCSGAGAPEIPPEHMQGDSRCPGPAVEPERARWHDPVLGRPVSLGLTPERLALCLRSVPKAAQGGPESG